jgi:formate dehydrogenase subunit delta
MYTRFVTDTSRPVGARERMNVERLVTMANDIAAFFAPEPDRLAAATVASHLTRFWERRMRRQLVELYRTGGTGLAEVTAAGVAQLSRSSTG